jgi:hypothetical protein
VHMSSNVHIIAGCKDVKLLSVKVGGKALSEGDYKLAPSSLTIPSPPSGSFQVNMWILAAASVHRVPCSISMVTSFTNMTSRRHRLCAGRD